MKKLLAIAAVLLITACSPSIQHNDRDFILPADLSHCRVVTLKKGGLESDKIYLIRCPKGYIGSSFSISKGDYSEEGSVYFN